MADLNTKSLKKEGGFNIKLLSKEKQEIYNFVVQRILDLQKVRKNHYGVNLDKIWAEADRDYIPHRLKTTSKKVIVEDETKGWRGSVMRLGSSNWQSDISLSNPFVKIQIALSILVDQNPSGVFTPASKKYQATTALIKQLYERSWEIAGSKSQLKLFIFNLAKYGWACARTYPLRITNKIKVLQEYNQENPQESKYVEKEVVEYNDIMRENLDPRNTWIDDMARPNNVLSIRDWCWRKVYDISVLEKEIGNYPFWKYVSPGGTTTETIDQLVGGTRKEFQNRNLVEVYFYENLDLDIFLCLVGGVNGVPVVFDPLPISDSNGNKSLSLWQTYWNLRHAESPYGIGIYEAIRYDQAMLDRIRNMTIDQLALSIYKMFFYQGTQSLTETGDITITPGVGKQVLDPKNINWLEVPPPGNQAWQGIEVLKKDIDETSGIGDPLMGVITGKTAFEIAQAKESALKRLKDPLQNILEALNQEGYITVSLMDLLYSIPEVYKITDNNLIEEYLKEIESDPDLYERDENGNFFAKIYREFPLNLDKDEQGNLIETESTRFFRVKPKFLKWDGIIRIKAQSILTPSKQIEKALDLEMYNILIPLLAQPPEIYSKIAKSIVKLYDKDPKDILPDIWLKQDFSQKNQVLQGQKEQPLFIDRNDLAQNLQNIQQTNQQQDIFQNIQTNAERFVPRAEIPERPKSLVQKIVSRITQPFRKV